MAATNDDDNGRTSSTTLKTVAILECDTASAINNKEDGTSTATNNNEPKTTTFSHFYCSWIAGVSSGAVSSVLVAPLDVLRTQWQVIGSSSSSLSSSVGSDNSISHQKPSNLVATIWKREGIAGFFRGLTATLLTVPAFWGIYCK
jgi:Mitochondrial carrier protein